MSRGIAGRRQENAGQAIENTGKRQENTGQAIVIQLSFSGHTVVIQENARRMQENTAQAIVINIALF